MIRIKNDTYIYIQEFDDGEIRYGITNNLERRINEHQSNYGDTFTLNLMVPRPVKRTTACTIEALLIQKAFDDNIPCKNNYVENKRYLFKNKDYLDSCPICEEIGCNISSEYIDQLIDKHKQKEQEYNKEYNKAWRKANKEKIREYRKNYYKNNKEKINVMTKEYRKNYYKKNRKRIDAYSSEYRKNYYKNNKEKVSEMQKRYREKNKEKYNAATRRRQKGYRESKYLELADKYSNELQLTQKQKEEVKQIIINRGTMFKTALKMEDIIFHIVLYIKMQEMGNKWIGLMNKKTVKNRYNTRIYHILKKKINYKGD